MVPTGPEKPRDRPAAEPAPPASPALAEPREKMMRPELAAPPPAESQPATVVHLPPATPQEPWPPPSSAPPERATTTVAPRAALAVVLGVLSLMCGGPVVGIIAIALGVSARRQIADSGGSLSGNGAAAIGIMLGILGTIIHGFGYLAALVAHR
jgi:hypothetical protein